MSETASVVQEQEASVMPYIHVGTSGCELRIPSECSPKYKYWAGGQSVVETLAELKAPKELWQVHIDTSSERSKAAAMYRDTFSEE